MTKEQRSSIDNSVWLCQSCSKMIDDDEIRYTAGVLEEWKRMAESLAQLEVENPPVAGQSPDVELIRFYTTCLDRPALQDRFREEGWMEDFDKAIEDTITAINTGCLRSRDGAVLQQGKGKAYLQRHSWRHQMDTIVDLLGALRKRYRHNVETGEIRTNASGWYHIPNPGIADWMDATRTEIVRLHSDLCHQAGLPRLHFPRDRWR